MFSIVLLCLQMFFLSVSLFCFKSYSNAFSNDRLLFVLCVSHFFNVFLMCF